MNYIWIVTQQAVVYFHDMILVAKKQNAKIEHDKALAKIIREMLFDHAELAKMFSENEDFRRWLIDMSFDKTYKKAG